MSLESLERISWLVKELNLVSNCAGQLSHPHLIIAMIYRFIFTLIKIHGASETYVGFQGSFGSGKSLPSLSNCLDKTNNPMSGCQSKSHEHKCRIRMYKRTHMKQNVVDVVESGPSASQSPSSTPSTSRCLQALANSCLQSLATSCRS